MRKMVSLVVLFLCFAWMVFACDGDGSYTEANYLNGSIELYCKRSYECSKDEFVQQYASQKDCVTQSKEELDTTSAGDDVYVYEPICDMGVFNFEAAKDLISCMKEVSCSVWMENDVCDEFRKKLCGCEMASDCAEGYDCVDLKCIDVSIDAGDPCSGDGTICSSDGKYLLKCEMGVLLLFEDCVSNNKTCSDGWC